MPPFVNYMMALRAWALTAVLAIQLCATAPIPLFAQEGGESISTAGTPRPKTQSEGTVPLGRGGYDVRVFVAHDDTISQHGIYLFHEPLIFIQADRQGWIKHQIDDTGKLTLYMRWDLSPESTQAQIRNHFARVRAAPSDSWIIDPLAVTRSWFESSREEHIRSHPLPPNTSFTAKGEVQVYFEFENRETAAGFVATLQGEAGVPPTDQLVFKYSFEGVSYELCMAEASYGDIQQIGRFRDLFGEGREGFAQRHQIARIFQDIVRTRTARGRCADDKVLRQMTNQAMAQLESPKLMPLNQLEKYASLDNDLRSDLSHSLNETSQSVSRDQDQEAFKRAASSAGNTSVSAGWDLFAASVSDSFSEASEEARQLFRDVLRNHGVSGEWEGERYIPKTLEVYSKEGIDSQWAQGVRIEYAIPEGATATFPIVLTQQSWLRGEQQPHERPDVLRMIEERLIQRIEELEKSNWELTKKLEESNEALTGMNDGLKIDLSSRIEELNNKLIQGLEDKSRQLNNRIRYKKINNPNVGGTPLDWCRKWGDTTCGQPAADAYCQSKGYQFALGFKMGWNLPPTRLIHGGRKICTGHCDRITTIWCWEVK